MATDVGIDGGVAFALTSAALHESGSELGEFEITGNPASAGSTESDWQQNYHQ